jgi:4'-phosphopantetheinyl transferase
MRGRKSTLSEVRCGRGASSDGGLSADGEIHLWRGSVDRAAEDYGQSSQQLLSADERQRAERYQFERDRRRFVVRRAALRMIIASYLDADPQELQFVAGPHGKPSLTGRFAGTDLNFNMTSSHERWLLAVTWGHAVGADLEFARPLRDLDGLIKTCLSKREADLLNEYQGAERHRVFYGLWTCKEACLKAIGDGLSRRLDSVQVFWPEDAIDDSIETHARLDDSPPLFVRSFSLTDGYLAAVASVQRQTAVKTFEF